MKMKSLFDLMLTTCFYWTATRTQCEDDDLEGCSGWRKDKIEDSADKIGERISFLLKNEILSRVAPTS